MKLFGYPVIVDDGLPKGEIRLTDWRSYIRIVNVGEEEDMELSKIKVRIVDDGPDDELHLILKGPGVQDLLTRILDNIYEMGSGESEPIGLLGPEDFDS